MKRSGFRMNRRQFASQVTAGTVVAAAGTSLAGATRKDGTLLAGAAETVATPTPKGTFLIGPMKPSTGVHDDLHARALILASGEERIAIVTLDYLGFDFAYTNELVKAASRAAGIPVGNVLLNCSHTHSAPLTAPSGPWKEQQGQPFYKMLPRKIAEVVKRAADKLQPAALRYRREPTQIGFNRRLLHRDQIVMAPNPAGAVLPWVDVLAVDATDGRSIAVLFSHAAHPVIVHEASTLISADYPGFAVQHLKRTRSKDTVYMFAQGCCGNINGFPLKGGIDAAQAAGRDLAEAVSRALEHKSPALDSSVIRSTALELELPLQPPPSVEECRSRLAEEQRPDRRQRFAELLAIAESGQTRTMRMPIHALRLGDFCLLAMAHEPFAEYHQFVNDICPFSGNMVLAYTNGLECYVGTQKDYELGERGGYETSPRGAAFMFDSRLPLSAASEELLKAGLRRTIDSLQRV